MSGKSHDLISTSLYYVSKHATRERIKSQLNCHVTFRRQLHHSILSSPYYQLLSQPVLCCLLHSLACHMLGLSAASLVLPPALIGMPYARAQRSQSCAASCTHWHAICSGSAQPVLCCLLHSLACHMLGLSAASLVLPPALIGMPYARAQRSQSCAAACIHWHAICSGSAQPVLCCLLHSLACHVLGLSAANLVLPPAFICV